MIAAVTPPRHNNDEARSRSSSRAASRKHDAPPGRAGAAHGPVGEAPEAPP